MRPCRGSARTAAGLFLAGVFAACAGTSATVEQRERAEQRLLAPLLRGGEVGCGELTIDVTPNFYPYIGQPAVDAALHSVSRERGATYRETVWTNLTGDVASGFVVTIGMPPEFTDRGVELRQQTRFHVVHQVRLRVHEDRRPMTLDVRAFGDFPVLLREAGGAPRDVGELRIRDGVMATP